MSIKRLPGRTPEEIQERIESEVKAEVERHESLPPSKKVILAGQINSITLMKQALDKNPNILKKQYIRPLRMAIYWKNKQMIQLIALNL